MTVLRREDVQSKVASWDRCPYRTVSSPILAIVPLIIRRLRGPCHEPHLRRSRLPPSPRCDVTQRVRVASAAQRKPASSRAIGHRDLGRRLMFRGQLSEPSTQPLLRLVRNRNHSAGLTLAAAGERDPDRRAMLIVPRRFHQHPPHQRVPRSCDATAPMLLPAGVLAWHQPQIGHQRRGRREPSEVMQLGEDQHRCQRIDAPETAQPPDPFPIRAPSPRSRPGAHPIPCSRASV